MNVLTETNKHGHLQVEKMELRIKKRMSACLDWLVDDDKPVKAEIITINNIRDWEINYDKIGTSSVTVTFIGVLPSILELTQTTVTSISVYGKLWVFDAGSKNNLLWNIPCNLKVEDLEVTGNDDSTANETYLNLTGDIW